MIMLLAIHVPSIMVEGSINPSTSHHSLMTSTQNNSYNSVNITLNSSVSLTNSTASNRSFSWRILSILPNSSHIIDEIQHALNFSSFRSWMTTNSSKSFNFNISTTVPATVATETLLCIVRRPLSLNVVQRLVRAQAEVQAANAGLGLKYANKRYNIDFHIVYVDSDASHDHRSHRKLTMDLGMLHDLFRRETVTLMTPTIVLYALQKYFGENGLESVGFGRQQTSSQLQLAVTAMKMSDYLLLTWLYQKAYVVFAQPPSPQKDSNTRYGPLKKLVNIFVPPVHQSNSNDSKEQAGSRLRNASINTVKISENASRQIWVLELDHLNWQDETPLPVLLDRLDDVDGELPLFSGMNGVLVDFVGLGMLRDTDLGQYDQRKRGGNVQAGIQGIGKSLNSLQSFFFPSVSTSPANSADAMIAAGSHAMDLAEMHPYISRYSMRLVKCITREMQRVNVSLSLVQNFLQLQSELEERIVFLDARPSAIAKKLLNEDFFHDSLEGSRQHAANGSNTPANNSLVQKSKSTHQQQLQQQSTSSFRIVRDS